MHILFDDSSVVNFELFDTEVAIKIYKSLKHLQHINLNFKSWDNPFNKSSCQTLLLEYAQKLNININVEQDIFDQTYLNYLHEIYEKNYNGTDHWLDFHEQIHRCEELKKTVPQVCEIDFREKAGPLTQKFNSLWMKEAVLEVKKGDIYIKWSELGKTPYKYWRDKEPDSLQRLCELAKPWITLRPKFSVALEDIDFLKNKEVTDFENWWKVREKQWCNHWNLDTWTLKDQFSVLVIGKVNDLPQMQGLLEKNICIKKIILGKS